MAMSLSWFSSKAGLPGNYLEIAIDAVLVTDIEKVKRLLRGGRGIVLLPSLNLEIMQGVEIVLNLLKGGERGLAVHGNRAVILREGDVGGGAAAAVVVECLGKCGADGEEAARPGKPVDRRSAEEPPTCRRATAWDSRRPAAIPICSFAAAMLRSLEAISGRRSSNCDGSMPGITGSVGAVDGDGVGL